MWFRRRSETRNAGEQPLSIMMVSIIPLASSLELWPVLSVFNICCIYYFLTVTMPYFPDVIDIIRRFLSDEFGEIEVNLQSYCLDIHSYSHYFRGSIISRQSWFRMLNWKGMNQVWNPSRPEYRPSRRTLRMWDLVSSITSHVFDE